MTVRLHGFATPVTIGAEHLALVAKRKSDQGGKSRCGARGDEH
jgi:hypothetical protein